MKQNKYDDALFFEKYSQFPRSVGGLPAAGEWRELEGMLPDFQGKRVLDLGCGFGWHCQYAAERGAAYVLGTDISENMLRIAREKHANPAIDYRLIAMEDIELAPQSFDVAISSLAFHYVADFDAICAKLARVLKPGGDFVFSAEHPIFTAQGPQDWAYGADGRRMHWPVDNYFLEGARDAIFLGEPVQKYHRSLTSYVKALLRNGFAIADLVEPQPRAESPDFTDEMRRPMMLLIAAKKN